MRIHNTDKGLAVSTDCVPRYVDANPFEGGKQAVCEAYRNISASGAKPLAVTNNLNFGNPEKQDIMAQIVGAVNGMGNACRTLNTPVVSGNVSLYNETNGIAVQPCPVIGMVGVINDLKKAKGCGLVNAGKALFVVGQSSDVKEGWLGCSVYARVIANIEGGAPPSVDPALEGRNGTLIRQAIDSGLIEAAHDISDGGLAIALSECCILSSKGAKIELQDDSGRYDNLLFAEGGSRIIFTTDHKKEKEWLIHLKELQKNFPSNVYVKKIGCVSSETFKLNIQDKNICDIRVEELTEKFNNSISGHF